MPSHSSATRIHMTASRRLRRGLIALGIAATLPAAITTSQAAAKLAAVGELAAVGGCSYSSASFNRGSVMDYGGSSTAAFTRGHTYICGADAEGDGSHWVDLGETYNP